MSRYSFSKVEILICGTSFNLSRDLLAAKSSKLCKLFKENPDEDLSHLLCDIPTTPKTFEHLARFCYGIKVSFTPENIIPISCLACYFGMTENHSPNNLLNAALSFFEHQVITGWNESISSLKAAQNPIILQQAVKLGLTDACVDSIISKALDNPLLLGEPIKSPVLDDDDDGKEFNGNVYKPNARRQLFVLDWKSEDLSLTTLHLQFYEPIIHGMIQCKMDSSYVASSLYQYAKRWAFFEPKETDEETSSSEGGCSNTRKDIIEAIERLLPYDRGILPCALLSKMLQYATVLEANAGCKEGFEERIGRQLDLATVDDLLIPSQGYSREEKYDTECLRRILKHFYINFKDQDLSRLVIVADLVEDYLREVAKDDDLKKDSFISFAEMAIVASEGTQRSSNGIYQAIDVYLAKHRYLTESEREEICAVLDCNKMTRKACEHAAQNNRLPVRVLVQVLFIRQLQLRETVTKEVAVQAANDYTKMSKSTRENKDDEEIMKEEVVKTENNMKKSKSTEDYESDKEVMKEEGVQPKNNAKDEEEDVKVLLKKMNSKVMELEKECLVMKKEIQSGYCRKRKTNIWRGARRKLGFIASFNNHNSHVKKIHEDEDFDLVSAGSAVDN